MRSIIFANHGVGDIIMAFPLIRSLSSTIDDSVLVLTRSDHESEIVRLCVTGPGMVRCLAVRDGSKANQMMSALRLIKHRPEVTVLTYDIEPLRGGILSVLSGAKIRIGPNHPIYKVFYTHRMPYANSVSPGFHIVEYSCQAAELLGRYQAKNIRISHKIDEWVGKSHRYLPDTKKSYVGIAFGSNEREAYKRVSRQFACFFLKNFIKKFPDVIPVLLGGKPEKKLNESIANKIPSAINLTEKTSQTDLLGILSRFSITFTTCNAISHFAAASGCPVIGFYGPTNPYLTGPYGVPFVPIKKEISCSPCYKRGFNNGCENPTCMEFDHSHIDLALTASAHYINTNSRIQ